MQVILSSAADHDVDRLADDMAERVFAAQKNGQSGTCPYPEDWR